MTYIYTCSSVVRQHIMQHLLGDVVTIGDKKTVGPLLMLGCYIHNSTVKG